VLEDARGLRWANCVAGKEEKKKEKERKE